MIEVRQIGAEHAALLATLQAATFRQAYAAMHASEDIETYCQTYYTVAAMDRELSAAETACCMGWLDSQPSGYYMVKHQDCPIALGAKSSELKQIYVLSAAYGSGLGQALFNHAIATMQAAGSTWVWLCVSDRNHRAQAFYRKNRFTKIGMGPVIAVGNDSLSSSILAQDLRDIPLS